MINKVFISALFSVVVLISCNPTKSDQELSSNKNIFHKIDPNQPMVEQPIFLSITAPDSVRFELGTIEGVNMSMGYLPVLIEPVSDQLWRGKILLGACTEPQMRWRVVLPWRDELTQAQGIYSFEFVTEMY